MIGPVRVGLVGAGPWAVLFTAPLLAGGPDCELVGVWARRGDAAAALAARHATTAAATFDDLLERSDAIAFAVPPGVQAPLAARAARAGRAVLLEKPIGVDLAQAEDLTAAIAEAGVVSQVVLTNRYRASMRAFLQEAGSVTVSAGRATLLADVALPGSLFATPWRLEHGVLLDLGPHVLDALDAALGPIADVRAAGAATLGLVGLSCFHDTGAISQATICATIPAAPNGLVMELFGPDGVRTLDLAGSDAGDGMAGFRGAMATLAAEFAAAVRGGTAHELDVRRGLHLQRLITLALNQIAGTT
jgi:predicted dehydrogenase